MTRTSAPEDDETPDPAVMDLFRELARASGDTLICSDLQSSARPL